MRITRLTAYLSATLVLGCALSVVFTSVKAREITYNKHTAVLPSPPWQHAPKPTVTHRPLPAWVAAANDPINTEAAARRQKHRRPPVLVAIQPTMQQAIREKQRVLPKRNADVAMQRHVDQSFDDALESRLLSKSTLRVSSIDGIQFVITASPVSQHDYQVYCLMTGRCHQIEPASLTTWVAHHSEENPPIGLDLADIEQAIAHYDQYCMRSKRCDGVSNHLDSQAAVRVTAPVALAYTQWLSKMTGKIFRVPSYREWIASQPCRHLGPRTVEVPVAWVTVNKHIVLAKLTKDALGTCRTTHQNPKAVKQQALLWLVSDDVSLTSHNNSNK